MEQIKKFLILGFMLPLIMSSSSWAANSVITKAIQGRVPVLSAPSNGALNSVDFSGTYANPNRLSTGDNVILTYQFNDPDGDADHSVTTIAWSYTPAGGGNDVPIQSTNEVATYDGSIGSSTITIPSAAVGAQAIKVVIQERSITGSPNEGKIIQVTDTSLHTSPGGGGGGGTGVTPPGPIAIGSNIAGGIFLMNDTPTAGSGALDYSRATQKPQVGHTYVFKAWSDDNADGIWNMGEADLTSTMKIQWLLDGTNSSASGNGSASTLDLHAIAGATNDTYSIPPNTASTSGAGAGDQGFILRVSFE